MNSTSLTGKKWIYREFNNDDIVFYKENFFLDEITSKLLSIRKIKKEDINLFLNPSIKESLPNPNILKDMNKATNHVVELIKKRKTFGIFGDYDVDGASSTALLGNYFKSIKHPFKIYIPDRKKEGYGPSKKSFDILIKEKVDLIFTVDCGTLSFEPIEYAKSKNVDVIVLDHHQSEINLPNAHSIINPNRLDDTSKLNYLCAAGVCFMFLVSINRKLREINWFKEKKIDEPDLIDFLDLVSLGTICDVVPLTGLNRAIVKQGLKVLKLKKNPGIKMLMNLCRIESKPTTYHLGYVLGPRINAGGRVGKCSHGANLLLETNASEIFKIASELEQFNNERKILEKELLNYALISAQDKVADPVIIIDGSNWHEGVIGIIASRIKDKYNKPTIIISKTGDIGKASARSIVGFDIGMNILSAVQDKILLKGGGHKMAGGFTIKMKNLSKFKDFLFKRMKKFNEKNTSEKQILLDAELSPSTINLDFFDKINYLSPFGSGNPEPKFSIENIKKINSRIVGNQHIKSILLGKDGSKIEAVAFNAVDNPVGQYLLNTNGNFFSIAGKLSLNEWKGKKNVEFIIDDISVNKSEKNKVPSSIG